MGKPNYKPANVTSGNNSPLIMARDLKKNTVIEGRFLGSYTITINEKPATKHEFELIEPTTLPVYDKEAEDVVQTEMGSGSVVSLLGTAELNRVFTSQSAGVFARLAYEGKKKGKKNSYHHFDVGIDESGAEGYTPASRSTSDEAGEAEPSTAQKIAELKKAKAIA